MQNIPREQIIKRFQSLPESLQEVIFSDKLGDAIIKNCTLRDIDENNTPIVGRLTSRVLLGYLRPELFALEIQKETGIDMEKAQLIARDLDTEIFSAVRLELKKLYPPTIQTPTVQSWRAESQPITNPQPKPRYIIPIPEKFLKQSADVAQKFNIMRPDLQQPINQSTRITDSKTNSVDDNLKSAGGGQVSQIAKEVVESQVAEARPLEVRPPTTNGLPQPQTQKATNNATTGGVQQAEVKHQEPPISPPVPTLKANEANEAPSFKPIVPLPTFIQTQFKKQDPRSGDGANENPGSRLGNDSEIKNLIGKFSTSATQKPKPPAESPYREKI